MSDEVEVSPADAASLWQSKCPHTDFEAEVLIMPRMIDATKKCANVRVWCADCGLHFRFEGLPGGIFGGGQPATISHMAWDAVLPIAPMDIRQSKIVAETCPPESAPAHYRARPTPCPSDGVG